MKQIQGTSDNEYARLECHALCTGLHEVNYISLDDFVDDVLPQSYLANSPQLSLVIAQLKKDHALKDGNYWADFPSRSSDADESESELYAPGRLVNVVAAIASQL